MGNCRASTESDPGAAERADKFAEKSRANQDFGVCKQNEIAGRRFRQLVLPRRMAEIRCEMGVIDLAQIRESTSQSPQLFGGEQRTWRTVAIGDLNTLRGAGFARNSSGIVKAFERSRNR